MTKAERTKQLLLNKNCGSCIYSWDSEGCVQGVTVKDTSKTWVSRYPPEHTCEKWRPYERMNGG